MPVILFVSAFPQDGMAGWRVLVQKRSRYVRSAPDVWGLPGGRLNEAEERLSREGADGDVEARRMAAVREAFEECGGGTPRACRGLYLGGRAATPCSLPPGIADHADPGNTLTSISRDIMLYVLANRGWDAALFGDDGRLQWKPRALRRYKGEIDENDPGSVCGYAWIPVEHLWSSPLPVPSSAAPLMPWVRNRTWLRAGLIMQKLSEAVSTADAASGTLSYELLCTTPRFRTRWWMPDPRDGVRRELPPCLVLLDEFAREEGHFCTLSLNVGRG